MKRFIRFRHNGMPQDYDTEDIVKSFLSKYECDILTKYLEKDGCQHFELYKKLKKLYEDKTI